MGGFNPNNTSGWKVLKAKCSILETQPLNMVLAF